MPEAKHAGGRPSLYNLDLTSVICARLAEGESLRSICRDDAMPCMSSVFKWLAEHQEFSQQYVRAREAQADAMADEILEISDDGSNDWMERHNEDGENVGWQVNGEHIQRSRLRVDARKWLASKLLPKKYSDRLDLMHKGDPAHPVVVSAADGKL